VGAYPKTFNARVEQVGQAFASELSQRADFWTAITSLPNGADVYHELGGDLDHFAAVLEMQPVQLGMELARLSDKMAARPRGPVISKVPPPIDPLNGGGAQEETDPAKMPMSDYAKDYERRRMQRAQERGY
jgi:hypothetical protein